MTERAVKEMVKGKGDRNLLRPVPLQERVFPPVYAVIRALMAQDVVNCDFILRNAVKRFPILTPSHAENIILGQRLIM